MDEAYVNANALVTADEVVAAEHVFLNKRRLLRKAAEVQRVDAPIPPKIKSKRKLVVEDGATPPQTPNSYLYGGSFDTIGLALSGGGIRSAAVCMGVMQAMSKHQIFNRVDYLSTVSGGGYAGAAVTVAMTHNGGVFPFFGEVVEKKDTPEMGELRANANYLKAGNFGEMSRNAAIYLRGIAANVLTVFPVLFLIAALVLALNPTVSHLSRPDLPFLSNLFDADSNLGRYFATSCIAAFLAALFYLVWATMRGGSFKPELVSDVPGWAVFAALVLAGVAFFELQSLLVDVMVHDAPTTVNAEGSVPSTTFPQKLADWFARYLAPLGVAMGFLGPFVGQLLKSGENETGWTALAKRFSGRILQILIGLSVPVLLWYFTLVLISWGALAGSGLFDLVPMPLSFFVGLFSGTWFAPYCTAAAYLAIFLLCKFFVWRFLWPNGNSPHRLYKERLGAAFCYIGRQKEAEIVPPVVQKLSKLDTEKTPFHIINTALNIRGSKVANRNGRNADFFMFSPLFCGSPTTKYALVEHMEKRVEGRRDASIDVATAIATSGAAFSANMGTMTVGLMATTLAMLNVRLGYWMPNPRQLLGKRLKDRDLYFLDELLGRLDESSENIYLTDGGHIENLGIYELLRRRCKLIIAVDAECDEELNFTSFVELQRYARIDLGVKISMKWDAIRTQSALIQANKGGASEGPHCAVGQIIYDNGGTGVLIYFKSSMSGDENDYVRDYNRRKRAFPHESTSDQFFNEEQFEVYRALGFHMADGVFDGSDKVQTLSGLQGFLKSGPAYGLKEARALLGLKVK